jgi:tetratricopeptide (TPR) repeat protein
MRKINYNAYVFSSYPMKRNYEYKVGGSLAEDAPSYVVRQADSDLYQRLLARELCYVFNSRQMGKSSLVVRTRNRLLTDGITCVTIDISGQGSQEINLEQWYTGIVYTVVTAINLMELEDFFMWWDARAHLSPVQRLDKFIEEVLLVKVRSSIVIFLDEIDSILSLDFPTGDFFALIRSCYNKRSQNPEYNRLTFALFGVATPSNLIADKRRTPFNIGRAIQLHGFHIHEIEPLSRGLEGKVDKPQAVMQAVLSWTGGQPFLTQKLCQLLVDYLSQTLTGKGVAFRERFSEAEAVERVVRSQIIENWESQDEPPHLKTIRDRIFNNEQRASRLLDIYLQILRQGEIVTDDSPEQIELRLSGLVVEHQGKLRVYNQIYELVFDFNWVSKALAKLRPYATSVEGWVGSNKDESWLLRGQELRDAQVWAFNKSLSDLDYQFLAASQELAKREVQIALNAERQAKQILAEAQQKAELALDEEKQANQRLAKTQRKTKRQMAIGVSVLGLSLVGAVVVVGDAHQKLKSAMSARDAAYQDRDTAYQQRRDAISQLNDKKLELESKNSQLETANQQAETARKEALAERDKKQLIVADKAKLEQKSQQLQQEMQGVMKQLVIAKVNRDKVLQQVKKVQSEKEKAQIELDKEQQRVRQANENLVAIKVNLDQVNQELQKAEQKFQEAAQRAKLAEESALEAQNQLKQAVEAVLQARKVFERLLTITDTETPLTVRGNHDEVTESYRNFLERLRNLDLIKDSPTEAQVLNSTANASFEAGKYKEALESFLQALKLYQAASDRIGEGKTLSNIGSVYNSMGDYLKALEYYQQALVIIKELNVDVVEADILNNIGAIYRTSGDYKKSLVFTEQAVELRKRLLGEEHPDVASSFNNLAFLYYSMGNYTQALPLYQRALAIQQKTLGKEHPSVAISLNNLAQLYQAQGRYMEAEPLYRRALTILEKTLGNEHPNVASSLNNLAQLYQAQGNYTQALPLYQQALAIRKRFLGEQHPIVASSLNNLAQLYQAQGNYAQALPLYQQALEMRMRLLGEQHPIVASSLNSLAYLYYSKGNYTQALSLYQRALAIIREVGDRAGEGQLLNAIGEVYSQLGQNQNALRFYQQSLAITREIGSKDLESNVLANIGVTYRALGDYKRAIEDFNQVLRLNPNYADVYYNRGLAHADLGNYQGAIADFNQVLQLNPNYADAYYNRGLALRNIGEKLEAIADFQQAANLYQQQGSTNNYQKALNQIRELQIPYAE